MADVQNWQAFIRGRWQWAKFGYELGFKGNCGFADLDAITEFNGRILCIEAKHFVGDGRFPQLAVGQQRLLERLAGLGIQVFVLYGDAQANDPQGAVDVNLSTLHDWRHLPLPERRAALKSVIDDAMGVVLTPALRDVFERRFASDRKSA